MQANTSRDVLEAIIRAKLDLTRCPRGCDREMSAYYGCSPEECGLKTKSVHFLSGTELPS